MTLFRCWLEYQKHFKMLWNCIACFYPATAKALPCCAPWMKAEPKVSNELPIQSHSCSFVCLCHQKKHGRDTQAISQLFLLVLDVKMNFFYLVDIRKLRVFKDLVKTCIPCFMLSLHAVEDKWFLQCPGLSCTWFCHVDSMVLFLKQIYNELCLVVYVWC